MKLPDFHDVVNALTGGAPIANGHISYNVDWSGGGEPTAITDGNTFAARVIEDRAELSWEAKEPHFRFESTATTKVHFAEIGVERNGVFFRS